MAEATRLRPKVECGTRVDTVSEVSSERGMMVVELTDVALAIFVEFGVIVTETSYREMMSEMKSQTDDREG